MLLRYLFSRNWSIFSFVSKSIWNLERHCHSRHQFCSWRSQQIRSRSPTNRHHRKARSCSLDYPDFFFFLFLNKSGGKIKIPYFIGFFIAILVNSYFPAIKEVTDYVVDFSKSSLKVALFLIGTGLSFQNLKISASNHYFSALFFGS